MIFAVEETGFVVGLVGAVFGVACLLVLATRRRAPVVEAKESDEPMSDAHVKELARLDAANARLEDELRDMRRRQAVVVAEGGKVERRAPPGQEKEHGAELHRTRKELDELREVQVKQRELFDGALDGMAVLERETLRFVDVNPTLQRITGYDAEELTAKSLVDLFCMGAGRPGKPELQRASREGRALTVELLRKDGRTVFTDVSVAVVGAGGDARLLAVVHDVSERRLLEQELQLHIASQNERERRLEDANRELALRAERIEAMNARLEELQAKKDEFVSTVSHELRTPLTSVRSFSEILLDYGDADETVRREFLEIIHKESKRLTRLVDDVLDLARIEADQVRLDMTEFDAKDVVKDAAASMAGTAKARGSKIRLDFVAQALPVRADRDKIQQLVMNLLGNSLKFGAQGGEIVVHGRPASGPGRIEITVSDDGPGIAPNELEHVFEKFRRSREGQNSTSGTGLGLAISREIVKLHGGRIWAENRAEGGARFRFELPAAAERPHAPPQVPAVVAAPAEVAASAASTSAPAAEPIDSWSDTGSLPPLGEVSSAGAAGDDELPPIR